jgi:hypothetical protein
MVSLTTIGYTLVIHLFGFVLASVVYVPASILLCGGQAGVLFGIGLAVALGYGLSPRLFTCSFLSDCWKSCNNLPGHPARAFYAKFQREGGGGGSDCSRFYASSKGIISS